MAFPVTLNGRTYTLTDFEGTNYVDGLPDAFEDFVTHAGDIYNSTSTTSNSIGTGSKTFTVEANKPYQAGTPLRIADAAAPSTNFLDTVVTSYSGTTLVVNSIGFGGSGTKTSWTVNIGGAKTIDGTLGLSQGGTGATDAAGARTNIDVYSKADADSRFLNVSGEASDVTMTGNVTIGDAAGDTLSVDATATFTQDVNLSGNIEHVGDDDTYFGFHGNNLFRVVTGGVERFEVSDSGIVINDTGGTTSDFRVESDSNTHMLFVDASTNRIGINESSPDAFLDISGNGATTSKMFEISTGGVGGGPSATFYGGYVQVQANNNATDNFGWYVTANHSGIDSDTTGIYGLATMSSSTKRSIGAYGSSSVNSGAVHNAPGNASSTVAAGVYADATTSGTSSNSTNAALVAYNKTTNGSLAYGAFIKVNSGATNPVPLAVDYDGYNVFDVTASDATFNEDSADRDFRVESDSNDHMLFVNAGENSVGIGTSTDTTLSRMSVGLTGAAVSGDTDGATIGKGAIFRLVDDTNWTTTDATVFLLGGGTGGAVGQISSGIGFSRESNANWGTQLRFYTHSISTVAADIDELNEQMRITSGGDVYLGTTSLPVMGSTSAQGVSIGNSGSAEIRILKTSSDPNVWIKKQGATGTAISFYKDTAAVGTVAINSSSVSYNTTSDYRLKENVIDLTGATTRLKQLEPKRFNFISDTDDTTVDGFLAHEVQSVVPEAITGAHNEVDGDGNPVYQGIDQSKLVPLLVATIKELEARITALESN